MKKNLSSHQLSSASDLDKLIVYRSIFGLDAMTDEGQYNFLSFC